MDSNSSRANRDDPNTAQNVGNFADSEQKPPRWKNWLPFGSGEDKKNANRNRNRNPSISSTDANEMNVKDDSSALSTNPNEKYDRRAQNSANISNELSISPFLLPTSREMRPIPSFSGTSGMGHLQNPQVMLSSLSSSNFKSTLVEITPMPFIPGATIDKCLGRLHLHFIKESWAIRENGGLGTFFHTFLSEAHAITRAHVAALKGNALLCYQLLPRETAGKIYRNQAYTMISICGDVVHVSYGITSSIYSSMQSSDLEADEAEKKEDTSRDSKDRETDSQSNTRSKLETILDKVLEKAADEFVGTKEEYQ